MDHQPSFQSGVTRYGSSSATPGQAAGVLRARARSHGLVLAVASDVDLVASSIAADAWMMITRSISMSSPATYGPGAVQVLSAILRRAAGQGPAHCADPASDNCSTDPMVVAAADAYAAWAYEHLGELAPHALAVAADDLCSAGPTTNFASAAEVMRIAADTLY
jgi:hypothetical protein